MNNFRHLLFAVIISNACIVSSAHALVVDFEEFDSIGLLDVFLGGNIDLETANATHRLMGAGQPFGNNNGITFSGGVLLQDPLNSIANPIIGDGGSIYYGTAFSPATSITTSNYTDTLTINITSDEMVQSVSGSFVHGLDTRADGQNVVVDYMVNYYVDVLGVETLFTQNIVDQVFDDGDSVVVFGLDTDTLAGSAMGAFINRVELTTSGHDFLGRPEQKEWDFLLSSVSFNEASPVPVPAALPLFVSALLGGFVAARRKKSSDHNISI
ncbi:MAG: hypothetical protein AB8C40_01125 [Gammaproteobacteria bacterium]